MSKNLGCALMLLLVGLVFALRRLLVAQATKCNVTEKYGKIYEEYLRGTLGKQSSLQRGLCWGGKGAAAPGGIATVSYTHLDVYKRQLDGSGHMVISA